jgi:cytochrome c5
VKFKALLCLVIGSLSFFSAYALQDANQDIIDRIKPVGSVHIAGAVTETASAGPRSGADVYNKACVACHTSGVLGAPKLHDSADWSPRMEKGFDTVWQNAINGIKAMPPMGTCGDCSNDDIKAAIEYMIEGI